MSHLDDVLKLLPKLTAAERATVRARLTALGTALATPAEEPVSNGSMAGWLLECVRNTMVKATGASMPVDRLKAMNAYHSFARKLPMLEEFLRQAVSNHYERRAVCAVGVDLLYTYMAKHRSVSYATMLYQIHRIPEVLNDQFPGYAHNGLLGLIARRSEELSDGKVRQTDTGPARKRNHTALP